VRHSENELIDMIILKLNAGSCFKIYNRVSCKTPRIVRQQNMIISPAGLGKKNDCAGEGHQ
jgi:hypothetical protein